MQMKKPNRAQFIYHLEQVYYGYFKNEGFNHKLALKYASAAAESMADHFYKVNEHEPLG